MALPRTYDAWYDNLTNRREPAADAVLFCPLDATANLVTPAALLTSVATGADHKLAFTILGADNLVHVIHQVLRYVPQLGQPRMPYDNISSQKNPMTFFTRTALVPRILTNDRNTDEQRKSTEFEWEIRVVVLQEQPSIEAYAVSA